MTGWTKKKVVFEKVAVLVTKGEYSGSLDMKFLEKYPLKLETREKKSNGERGEGSNLATYREDEDGTKYLVVSGETYFEHDPLTDSNTWSWCEY